MTIYAIATDWLARVEELWIARSTVRSVNSVQFKSTNVYCAAYYFELIIFWLDISIISKRAIGQSSSPTFEMIIKMKAEAYSLYWANGAVVLIVKPPNVHSQCSSLFFLSRTRLIWSQMMRWQPVASQFIDWHARMNAHYNELKQNIHQSLCAIANTEDKCHLMPST